MASWVCGNDQVRYSVGAPCCPQCGANEPYEEGDETMAKISRHGGPSNVDDPNLPPVYDSEGNDVTPERDEDPGSWTEGKDSAFTIDQSKVPADAREQGVDEDAQAQDADEPFDPGQHTVNEVLDYLETSDDAERRRVLEAESIGKNRARIRA